MRHPLYVLFAARMKRINAWSSPRNISTAFMYSFAQRPDTTVVDEPLYAHYLTHTDTQAIHPGREAILKSQENNGAKVVNQLLNATYPSKLVLFKQMTHHLISISWTFLEKMDNILLIRDPRAIIASYSKVVYNPSIKDVGVKKQAELFDYLKARGTLRAVIDSKELLLDPAGVLKQLCFALDIPFMEQMLSWSPGKRPEDGVWAPYWYDNVRASSGFQPYQAREVQLRDDLSRLAEACQPYYQRLYKHAIKAKK